MASATVEHYGLTPRRVPVFTSVARVVRSGTSDIIPFFRLGPQLLERALAVALKASVAFEVQKQVVLPTHGDQIRARCAGKLKKCALLRHFSRYLRLRRRALARNPPSELPWRSAGVVSAPLLRLKTISLAFLCMEHASFETHFFAIPSFIHRFAFVSSALRACQNVVIF